MCEFNAREKLAKRRSAFTESGLSAQEAYEVIRQIDRERWEHARTTGCECWDQARSEAEPVMTECGS